MDNIFSNRIYMYDDGEICSFCIFETYTDGLKIRGIDLYVKEGGLSSGWLVSQIYTGSYDSIKEINIEDYPEYFI